MKNAALLVFLACAGTAVADPITSTNLGWTGTITTPRTVLVNQGTTAGNGTVDQNFPDFPAYSASMVDDFSTGGQTWNLTRFTTYYTVGGTGAPTLWNPTITTGTLSFYAKSGALPGAGDVQSNLGNVSISLSLINGGTVWAATCDVSGIGALQGLNGNYWIGLTPTAAFGTYSQEFHLLSSLATNGDGSALRNGGGGFGVGTNWISSGSLAGLPPTDMLMTIEGNIVPVPGTLALVGVGGLLAARRRR